MTHPAPPATAPQVVRWHPFDDADALRGAAFAWIASAAEKAIAARGVFRIVLAGGETPRGVYAQVRALRTDWSRWEIWFGDERCTPADAPDRNSTMARVAWLEHVAIPSSQVHVIPAEVGAEPAASDYAARLATIDAFDLVLLGLGEDGHTASLFPGCAWGGDTEAADAMPVHDAPKPPPERVSLSASRLSHTRAVVFLVTGESKRDAVLRWRAGEAIPAAAIRPEGGVDVLLDTALLRS